MKRYLSFLLLTLLCNARVKGQDRPFSLLSLLPHSISADNGKTYAGELGKIQVLENRDDPKSNHIEIPFFRLRTSAPNPLAPIFVLAGGPGDDPSLMEELKSIVPPLTQFGNKSDIILLDQRGNGNSKPRLNCTNAFGLPLDVPLDRKILINAYRNYIVGCRNHWEAKGVDLKGYNVVSMADDLDELRQLLDYDKIMLFSGSFGSHHGLTYLKRYPKRVDRMSLDSPEGLQHTIKLPYEVDKVLVQLSDLVAEDPVLSKKIPSFVTLVIETLDALEKKPVTCKVMHPGTSEEVNIVLGKLDLQLATAMTLGRMGYRALPYYYLQMKEGDFSWLANWSIGLRHANGSIGNLMASLTDCASGVTSNRRQEVSRQAEDAILGDALNNVIFEVCDVLPLKDLKNDLVPNFTSKVPLLVVCGTQDAKTPLRNGIEIMNNFEHARLLVVSRGSHDLFNEVFDELAPYLIGFLSAEDPMEYPLVSHIVAPLDLRLD